MPSRFPRPGVEGGMAVEEPPGIEVESGVMTTLAGCRDSGVEEAVGPTSEVGVGVREEPIAIDVSVAPA